MTTPTPTVAPARRRRSGDSRSLARRQDRRFTRFKKKIDEPGTTADHLVAAAALYVRGVLTDLPPAAAERLAQRVVEDLTRAVDEALTRRRSQ